MNTDQINTTFEKHFWDLGVESVAGIDEAGRGPLAGPVVAAAVIFPVDIEIDGVNDSKKISEKKRERLFKVIQKSAVDLGIGIVHEREIDKLNILEATFLAMRKAIGNLKKTPDQLLVDGNRADIHHIPQKNIIGGDAISLSIAAASIIAKVTRDRIMINYDKIFLEYGFAQHKGYGTKKHRQAIEKHGSTPIHRKSFNPVAQHLPTFAYLKDHNRLGKLGEQLAACGLVKLGYQILELNYRVHRVGEIDIIHKEGEQVVFSEVKTLSSTGWGEPVDRIDIKKRERIIETANQYLSEKSLGDDIRYDVISVQFFRNKPRITRIKSGLAIV